MEQKRTLSKWISARRYIREFAADYAERYAEDPAEIERDIIAAKKQNHISLNEYEWVGYHDRTEAQKRTMSHCGRARSSAGTSPTAATSRSS